MFDLRGTRVLIAGGSSGIGLSTAELLVTCGADVVINGRDPAKLDQVKERLGPQASTCAFDAGNAEERRRALAGIGAFDHLVVALSGGKGAGPIAGLAPADLRSGFDGKFWVHFSLAQESLGCLDRTGSITFVTAISARAANPGTAGLAAINAAIEGMVRPLAVELRPRRVNAVSPGVIDTPWWNRMQPDQKQAAFAKFAAATPAGRVGRPEDIAQSIVFLIGNSFMTGCVLECDGGLRLVGQSL
ncbi:SDR family oxidoreductase [Rhodanobacter umsongensis]|uniref:SDR family oxidoreductase n=1 Tax=Rhodanobacter umsongensis TaxID=633153 RepID=A0ABW0JH88_9GAMM